MGSVAANGASHTVGAGVSRPADGLVLRVDPARSGAINPINGVELAAIMVALDDGMAPGGRVIVTDSKTSLHLIQRQLHDPISNKWSTHYVMLVAIAARMSELAAAGHTTHLIKVKSHIGVTGNEEADRLANEARDPSNCEH